MARVSGAAVRSAVEGVWESVTPLGRTVLGLGVASWAMAWVWDWEELAVIAVMCLVSVLIGVAFLLAARSSLSVVSRLETPRVVVGDEARALVEATNPSDRRLLPVRMETRVGDGVAPLHVPTLAGGATHVERVRIATHRRAVVPVGPVRSVQGDPLGLVRREIHWTGSDDLYVHPKSVVLGSMTTGWMRDLEGETTNDRSPSDVAFHTLREYVIGDDVRHVHWRTTARQPLGKLMVREFVDTRRAHVALALSLTPEDYRSDEEFEVAVSTIASIGLRALADEQQVTCVAGGRVLPSYHRSGFMDGLAGVERRADLPGLAATIARSKDAMSSASIAVVVAGSRAEAGRVKFAADRIGPQVKTIVVRADLSGESAFRQAGGAPLIELGSLEDLPRMMWAALGR